ncbi:hypothetical protein, partial [Blastomonas sp. CCH8-A3]|uniref:hypothetical protein n=1 Tax=Blastomonas sp. CCH8-A3 TaxID=1768743 RepID=UPI001E2B62B8
TMQPGDHTPNYTSLTDVTELKRIAFRQPLWQLSLRTQHHLQSEGGKSTTNRLLVGEEDAHFVEARSGLALHCLNDIDGSGAGCASR